MWPPQQPYIDPKKPNIFFPAMCPGGPSGPQDTSQPRFFKKLALRANFLRWPVGWPLQKAGTRILEVRGPFMHFYV